MKSRFFVVVAVTLAHLSAGMNLHAQSMLDVKRMTADIDLMQKQSGIAQKYGDTEAWREHRQKITTAIGDRIFDQDFARVFDSLVVAVSSLELEVKNMERTSGYIQAAGVTLPPAQAVSTRRTALYDWCKQNKVDSTIFDEKFHDPKTKASTDSVIDFYMSGATGFDGAPKKSLTFQLVKMGDQQTKVKLRFSGVIYPPEMEEYYKMIWKAVDKQLFVDKTIEGAVEERKTEVPAQKPAMDSQIPERLRRLKELRSDGTITESEYESQRKALIDLL